MTKSELVQLRVTPDMKKAWTTEAKRLGLTISSWLVLRANGNELPPARRAS